MNIKKILIGGSAVVAGFSMFVTTSFAATTYALVGDASIVAGGNPGNAAQIRSDTTIVPNFGGVSVVLNSPIPWASLTTLSTDFNVTDDNCGGGSPRVQIRVDTTGDGISDGSVRVALGPSPSFTGCSAGWQSTGNLIGNADAGRYDYSVFGGSPFTTYSNAPAVVLAGQVVGVFVVVDGSWSVAATGGDGEQTTLIDNITVNSDITTFDPVLVGPPTDKNQCKDNGWETFNNPTFNNQGDCVSYLQSNPNAVGNKVK